MAVASAGGGLGNSRVALKKIRRPLGPPFSCTSFLVFFVFLFLFFLSHGIAAHRDSLPSTRSQGHCFVSAQIPDLSLDESDHFDALRIHFTRITMVTAFTAQNAIQPQLPSSPISLSLPFNHSAGRQASPALR